MKRMAEEGKEDGDMIRLRGMKKNLEEEKKRREERKRMKEEEKRKKEEEQRRAEAEKHKMEERIKELEQLVDEMKTHSITSLDGVSLTFPQTDNIKREGNIITHTGSILYRNCFIGGVKTSV